MRLPLRAVTLDFPRAHISAITGRTHMAPKQPFKEQLPVSTRVPKIGYLPQMHLNVVAAKQQLSESTVSSTYICT